MACVSLSGILIYCLLHASLNAGALGAKGRKDTRHDFNDTPSGFTEAADGGNDASEQKEALLLKNLPSFKSSCWHANFSPPAPINHTPLPFIIDPASLCSGDVFLLLVVHSAVSHRERRDLIRSTWGSVRNIRGDRIVTVFVVGTTSEPTVSESLKREAETQADILQADFVDSYRNLTYKHLYWLKWVTHNCHSLRFVMKVDDDVMVNVFHLHQALTERMAGWKNFLNCQLNRIKPFRNSKSKWYVSWKEWPTKFYPVYCKGLGYIMSADIIQKLHMCAKWRKYFWIDDVFVSGALADALRVKRIEWKSGWRNSDMHPKFTGREVDQVIVITESGNSVMPRLHRQVWKAMMTYSFY